jgi:hypothetical protein
MRTTTVLTALALTVVTALAGCSGKDQQENAGKQAAESAPAQSSAKNNYAAEQLAKYADVTLKADLSGLSANQKKMIGLLIDASDIMNDLYWRQAFGDRDDLLSSIKDPATRQFAEINYGPWDRLNDFKPFVEGFGKRPPGANFYPQDMTKDEFHKADLDGKTGLYTLLRRDADGSLMVVPYHEAYKDDLKRAADLLRQASKLADDKEFGHYLAMRADALVSDDYQPSDFAWMDMKNNPIDIVIGPIETYEDQLFGYKASYEAYVLLKDQEWSKKLSHFIQYLPELQKGLPVPDAYKAETPGTDSDLNAYNVLYYAGNANAGAKTIAINLPNDEEVQLKKGTRRLQLENAMRAKFDKIMVPIADELIVPDQQKNVTFNAFFQNTMFHEVAHGLGIKNTLTGKGTVREALKEYASTLEEGKADILGLYMITRLAEKGELDKDKLMDNYVTFLAGIFRSVRFGAADAHGTANMVRFNFFKEMNAFSRDDQTGRYRVNFDNMQKAMTALSKKILMLQGDGDYAGAKQFVDTDGVIHDQLQSDLDRLNDKNIPVDIVFTQGRKVLGLNKE